MQLEEKLKLVFVFVFQILSCLIATGQQSISAIKILPLGSVVTTTGTITSGDEWGQIRYMQDAIAGIAVYSNLVDNTEAGDSVIITGVLSSYRGELQLSPVMSFQKIGEGYSVVPIVLENFNAIDAESHSSRVVSFGCAGIVSCEAVFEEGTLSIYDEQGRVILGLMHDGSPWIGQAVFQTPVSVTGIWTSQDGQHRLRIQQLADASEGNCHYFLTPKLNFLNDLAHLSWGLIPEGTTYFQWGIDSFNNALGLGPGGHDFSFTPPDIAPGEIYQGRLQQTNTASDTFYSTPIWFTAPSSGEEIEIFFNRSVNTTFSDGSAPVATGSSVIESDVIARIDQVTSTLDIAMYNTGRAPIIQAVNRALQRGVEVRYIADDETSNSALDAANFPVMYRSGDGIMHHKFIIADVGDQDKAWLWTGSTNFSSNQLSTDPNHAYVIHDQAFARNYQKEFDEIWGTEPNHSDGRVGESKDDNTCHLFSYNGTAIESYFSPSDETECHIMNAVSSADHQLLVGLLLLTSEALTDEIIVAHQRGVEVRVILEDEESSSFSASRLTAAGVPFEFHDPSNIYHHKYAIIDEGHPDSDPIVISGSHNWTWSADNINDENTLIFHDQSVTNIFRQEFEARWAELNTTSTSLDAGMRWQYFPNPAKDIVHLTNAANESCSIQFIDVDGRLCLTSEIEPEGTISLNVSSKLMPGSYFIKWIWKDQLSFSKLTVVR